MRVTSSLWVAAHIRRCFAAGAFALVERKGADEAGAIFLRADRPDGMAHLFLPAPMSAYESGSAERKWEAYKGGAPVALKEAEETIARQMRMDPDGWVVVIEDRQGRSFLPEGLLV